MGGGMAQKFGLGRDKENIDEMKVSQRITY